MKVISVDNVSKKFILAHDRPKNLADALRGAFGRSGREDFWALKDVSFEVAQGEAIGIIGHNGAGKSTMLKLLTGIMEPTSGHIRTRGRVSALIEVGAGFHPEMTGRENIYLNGSILGMGRQEISRKLDDIVAFAELERFIDMPVKRYSSGMYARLGFAVAAHVDPEVLVVDEVLSVGDAAFQEKCSKRMQGLCADGTTTVFVSHNLGAVAALCSRVAVLDHGVIHSVSAPEAAVRAYRALAMRSQSRQVATTGASTKPSSQPISVSDMEIGTADESCAVYAGGPLHIRVHYTANGPVIAPRIGIHIVDSYNRTLVHLNNAADGCAQDINGSGYCDVYVPSLALVPGAYTVIAKIADVYGAVVYDNGSVCRELCVHAPDTGVDNGITRLGFVWANAEWSYKQTGYECADAARE